MSQDKDHISKHTQKVEFTETYSDANTAIQNDEVSLKELILKIREWCHFLLSKWKIILIAGILGGALGLTYAILKKPVYTAELSFALQDESGNSIGGALGLASQLGVDLGGPSGNGAFSGDNLIELIKSRLIIEKVLLSKIKYRDNEITLAEMFISFNNIEYPHKGKFKFEDFGKNHERDEITFTQDSLLKIIYKKIIKSYLSVDKIDKKLSIINIRVTTENELFSKFFTEKLINEVSQFYIETKTKKSMQNVKILQRQTDSVRNELNQAIIGVAKLVDINPNPNPGLQVLRAPSQKRQIDIMANQAILTELVKNLELSKITLRKETPLFQIIDTPILPLDKSESNIIVYFLVGLFLTTFLFVSYLITNRILFA